MKRHTYKHIYIVLDEEKESKVEVQIANESI